VPQTQPKRARLWLPDGSYLRLRPERNDHVWAYDGVPARSHDGRAFRRLTIVDESTRECLRIGVGRRLNSKSVLEFLESFFLQRGVPEHIRRDKGSEFAAKAGRMGLGTVGVKTRFLEPGSPRGNGYIESFNGKVRDELVEGDGGTGTHRVVALPLERHAAAQLPRLSGAGPVGAVASRSRHDK